MIASELLTEVKERCKASGALPMTDGALYKYISRALYSFSVATLDLRNEALPFSVVAGQAIYDEESFTAAKPVYVLNVAAAGIGFFDFRGHRGMVTEAAYDSYRRISLSGETAGTVDKIIRKGHTRFELAPKPNAAEAAKAWAADAFYAHPAVSTGNETILFGVDLERALARWCKCVVLEIYAQGDTKAEVAAEIEELSRSANQRRKQALIAADAYAEVTPINSRRVWGIS